MADYKKKFKETWTAQRRVLYRALLEGTRKVGVKKELLWKAWPDGYLAVRGVGTIAGWQCVRTPAEGVYANTVDHTWWLAPVTFGTNRAPFGGDIVVRSDRRVFGSVRQDGKLLPNVDPEDTATWACLLQELAEAAHVETGPYFGHHLRWEREVTRGWPPQSWWSLTCKFGGSGRQFDGIDTDDPAEALVLARIQLREAADDN